MHNENTFKIKIENEISLRIKIYQVYTYYKLKTHLQLSQIKYRNILISCKKFD